MSTTFELDPVTTDTLRIVDAFNAAFGAHDVDGVMALMTEDVVFENTRPAPDGERHEGQAAVRSFWAAFFQRQPSARFTAEDIFATGDRCAVRWRYDFLRDGVAGHVRGVDIFRVRDGRVCEKLSYVKG